MNYTLNDEGDIVESKEEHKTGRYKWIDGKMVRVGDATRYPVSFGRDDLGVKGVFNPADGKTYDSRSEYYKSVKAQGLEIMGDDAPKTPSKPKTKDITEAKSLCPEAAPTIHEQNAGAANIAATTRGAKAIPIMIDQNRINPSSFIISSGSLTSMNCGT